MGVDTGSAYSSIRIRLTDLDNDLKGVYARLNQLEQNITKTTNAVKSNTNAFSKSWQDLTKSFISGQLAVEAIKNGFSLFTNAIKDSIRVATESQEMISKYDVVFSGMGDSSESAAQRFSDAFDLAGATSKEMLSNTGNLLQGMGATKEESLDLSLKVNTLASDLASFTNNQGGAKSASEALTKALLGEKESMKTLGIAILDSDVNARVAKNGQSELTGTALKLAKAQATLQLITEQSKNAIGDYARTQNSAANIQKRAAESTKELQIQLGSKLNPVVTLGASLWDKLARGIAGVLEESNKFTAARDAEKKGNETTEQEIILLQKQKQAYAAVTVVASKLGPTAQLAVDLANAATKKHNDAIDAQIAVLRNRQAIESKISSLTAISSAQRTKEQQAELDKQNQLLATYDKERGTVKGILDDSKTDYQKIQDQIDAINKEWAAGTLLEKDREAALEILVGKQNDLTAASAATGDADREAAQNKLATMQETLDAVDELGNAEVSGSEKARAALIEQIKQQGYVPEQEQEMIDKVNEYYDAIADQEAMSKFASNVSAGIGKATELFSAFADLVNQITQNEVDAKESALEDETAALEDALETRQNLETQYIEDKQDAEDEALKTKYSNLSDELDAEMQAKEYALGLADADTVEQYAKELEIAKATGDADKIKTAQDAYDKAVIEQEYQDKKTASAAQQVADQAALDKKQAEEKSALEAKQAAEKTALDEAQAKKKAEIEYKANLTSWGFQLALATASAAQGILNASTSASGAGWPAMVATIPLMTGLAAATGALQVAAVSAAKPVLSYATGGIVPGSSSGTLVNVAENGSSEVMFNTGSSGQAFVQQMANAISASLPKGQTVVLQVGTLIGGASSYRELNRMLAKYGNVQSKRTGS